MLESLCIESERYNCDSITNNNGYKLIDICKNHDLHTVNGRFGNDKGIGETTCKSISAIDYVIASPELFTKINDFMVDMFDPLLSDVHNTICLELKNNVVPTDKECFKQTKTKKSANCDSV